MNQITRDKFREIVKDFADAIKQRLDTEGVAPDNAVIDFRDWRIQNPELAALCMADTRTTALTLTTMWLSWPNEC